MTRPTRGAETGDGSQAFRLLPQVDEVLRDPRVAALVPRVGRDLVQLLASEAIEAWRDEIRAGQARRRRRSESASRAATSSPTSRRSSAARRARASAAASTRPASCCTPASGARRCIPRSPRRWPRRRAPTACSRSIARPASATSATSASRELLARLTGAEAAIGVNNNAGAVLLLFQTFAGGREAIVSRGELVEIGGSFRVPDVMARAGASARRGRHDEPHAPRGLRAGDRPSAPGSSSRCTRATSASSASPRRSSPAELASSGAKRGIATGVRPRLGPRSSPPERRRSPTLLGGEPLVRDAVASGVDVVAFSGDKLLGAPQAGLLVGKRAAIEALRKNPIYRALRLDKVALAGLETTLELLLAGRGGEIPARAMLARDAEAIRAARGGARGASRARSPASRVAVEPDAIRARAAAARPASRSRPSSCASRARGLGASALAAELRAGDPPSSRASTTARCSSTRARCSRATRTDLVARRIARSRVASRPSPSGPRSSPRCLDAGDRACAALSLTACNPLPRSA